MAGKPAGPWLFAMGLLASGTSLALYGQVITNVRAVDPAAQVIAWTKYAVNLLISAGLVLPKSGTKKADTKPRSTRTEAMAVLLGILDVIAYSLNCLGFPKCGSALTMVVFAASGQIFTAFTRRMLLRKRMSNRQMLAVAVVTAGLVLRAIGNLASAQRLVGADADMMWGLAYIMASAAGYSLLGVVYEWLVNSPDNHLSHAEINLRMSFIGVAAMTAFQAMYTWPRRQALVIDLMAAQHLEPTYVVILHGVFGVFFTAHSFIQGRVLQASGALTVNIVNALRAATVTLASSALFCRGPKPQQCLTMYSASSAAVVTAGALLWATSPSLPTAERIKAKET